MLQKCTILCVAGVFFKEPTMDHYLKEISKKANIAHTSVKNHLDLLESLDIIDKKNKKQGKRLFPIYRARFDSEEYKENKRIYNLLILKQSKIVKFLNDALMPSSIVMFGSYFRGEDIEDSDIDLYLECKGKKLDLSKFKKILNRNIQLHFKQDFKKYPKELKNNIVNGIVLKGFLEGY